MAKQDRCAQLQKEASKARRKITVETRAAQKSSFQEEGAPKQDTQAEGRPEVQSKNNGNHNGVPNVEKASSFRKAAAVLAPDDDDEYEPVEEPTTETKTSGQPKAKKETAASRKKQQADRIAEDLQLLGNEQKEAMKKRIIGRLLRIFLVGFILEARQGGETPARDNKPKKKGGSQRDSERAQWSIRGVLNKVDLFGGPFMLVLFMCAVLGARMFEEGYHPDSVDRGVNFYEALGVTMDADILSIRKSYKALALSWHPDKNPGCEACPAKFAVISEAYETLSNPEKRKAYDSRRAPEGSLDSMASVELTSEDFEFGVLRSNDVWVVQVYDPHEGQSKGFHPLWEDTAHSYGSIAKFGRIDASRHRRALDLLPQRVPYLPIVFRFARGHLYDTYLWQGNKEERGSSEVGRFVMDGYPKITHLGAARDAQRFWEKDSPRILIIGPISKSRRGGGKVNGLSQVQHTAHVWTEFMEFATVELSVAKQIPNLGVPVSSIGSEWIVAYHGKGAAASPDTVTLEDIKDVPGTVQEIVKRAISSQAPHVTVRNYQQLCSVGGLGQAARTFCLFLVDAEENQAIKALEELNASRTAYAQEVLELKSSGEDTEELFHVQPVRISTRTSRWPWRPAGASSGFSSVWAEAKKASAFVFELETRRIAAVRSSSLQELLQQIAYEDLKFHELPETLSVVQSLPDPEISVRKELRRNLSTPFGATVFFLFLAAAIAILPELPLLTGVIAVTSALVILPVFLPGLCRQCIAPAWCMMSTATFECQARL